MLELPTKITIALNLSLVNGYFQAIKKENKYKIVVNIRFNQLEDFKKLQPPSNVSLLPRFSDTSSIDENKPTKIEVGANIKEVLLESLGFKEKKDLTYIKNTLKEL